jgi:hypothetical protein
MTGEKEDEKKKKKLSHKRKKSVFISSTFEDLKNHRRKIWELLEKYEVNIRGMERFGARKEAPLTTCISEVEQCEIFVGIIAFRLGSIDEVSGMSFTQKEYERANELNREILIYMIDEKDSRVTYQDIDFGDRRDKLIAFKSILKERHTVDFFTTEDDLEQKIRRRFNELLAAKTEEKEFDDYAHSKELIHKFLLLPEIYSGREIKLEVDFVGQPFPASKSLCSNFNLAFGRTIGVKVRIKKPQIDVDENLFEYIIIGENNINDYFSLQKNNNIEIYGNLQFSENDIDKVEAKFVRKVYHIMPSASPYSIISIPLGGKREVVEADGRIIIKLTKILKE